MKVNRPDCITVNAVIGAEGGKKLFYTFESPSSWEIGMSCMQGTSCGSSDKEAQVYADENKLTLKKDFVVMRRLSDIFAEHELSEFGWIMVDVEGAEDIVIPTIDLTAVTAKFISYEGAHGKARAHLGIGGYKESFEVGPDVFYEKKTGYGESESVIYSADPLVHLEHANDFSLWTKLNSCCLLAGKPEHRPEASDVSVLQE